MSTTSKALEVVTRICATSYDEKPIRHKFCKYLGKIGTTSTTIIWIVDKEEVTLGDSFIFIEEKNESTCPANKKNYMKYINYDSYGRVDNINDDGYIFISR